MSRLHGIQQSLCALYDLDIKENVEDFLCSMEVAASLGYKEAALRHEVLLVLEEEGDVHVGLYLDPPLIDASDRVEGMIDFQYMYALIEGVSHFLYLMHKAQHGLAVSLIELELQAEVDKYMFWLKATGTPLDLVSGAAQRSSLYELPLFIDAENTVEGVRYREASYFAHRFVRKIEQQFAGRLSTDRSLQCVLRRFYRSGFREKVHACSG